MTKQKLWELIEAYRMSGGREEHHARKELLDDVLDELLAHPKQKPVTWDDVLGAVARGWTHDANKHKQMDVELATAIAKEVQAMILAKL